MSNDPQSIGGAARHVGKGIRRGLSEGWLKMAKDQEERIKLAGEYTAELVRIAGLALAGIGFLLTRATENLDGSAVRFVHFDSLLTKITFTIATLAFAAVFFGAVMERQNLRQVLFGLLRIADRMRRDESDGVDYSMADQEKDDEDVKSRDKRALVWAGVSMYCVSIGALFLAITFVGAVWRL